MAGYEQFRKEKKDKELEIQQEKEKLKTIEAARMKQIKKELYE